MYLNIIRLTKLLLLVIVKLYVLKNMQKHDSVDQVRRKMDFPKM